MADNEGSAENQTFGCAIRSLLESAIDSLPEDYRSVLMLRDIEGLNASETAECLSLDQENVRVRLLRARVLLRRRLFERAGNAAPDAFQFLGARCDRVVGSVLKRILR